MDSTSSPMINLHTFTTPQAVSNLILLAKYEDMGVNNLDLTSTLFVDEHTQSQAKIVARRAGKLAGAVLIPEILASYDSHLQYHSEVQDSSELAPGQTIGTIQGALRSLLSSERVILNFLTHLSGIATLTQSYVSAIAGTETGIYDTRKTIPGLRGLHKYAIACGGGRNHRMGLYDAILVKDNHIAHTPPNQLGQALAYALHTARHLSPPPAFIEVEVDNLTQLESVISASSKPDIVLLDNMPTAMLSQAVAIRNRLAPAILLEASGGVNLTTVRAIALTGVDRISVGALTHSAPSLDIGLDIDPT